MLYAKWIAPVYELILEITVPVAADSVKDYVEGRLTAEFGGDADVSFTVSSGGKPAYRGYIRTLRQGRFRA